MPTKNEILKLCDDWCAAATQPEGGLAIGGATERFRLLRNGVVFHELQYEELCAAVVGLSKVLLQPGLNTIIDQDHFGLWSWCGEVLLGAGGELFSHEEHEIKSLFEAAIHASLANCRKPPANREEFEEQRRIDDLQPLHAKRLLGHAHLALAYLGFPLLEALLKRACREYVAPDGQIVQAFSVETPRGGTRNYSPDGSYRNRQCSSLRDLMFLHLDTVACESLQQSLSALIEHVQKLALEQHPFDTIYKWRNQSLHGTTNFQTIGGTLLNISILIALDQIGLDFQEHRDRSVESCRREAQFGNRSPWSYYPPY